MIESNHSACTSILIGENATTDGSIIIGRNEDDKPNCAKHLAFHEEKDIPNNHFKSNLNKFEMDLPTHRYAYSSTPNWSDKKGVYEESGINQFGVAMSATETTYANDQVQSFDPFKKTGIIEEAMVTCILPYVKTAREAIARFAKIIKDHTAGESDGILFADPKEAWYFEIGTAHYWVAQRIPDDCYAVAANELAIQEIDFNDSDNFITAPGLQKFVEEHNLWPNNKPFNWRRIFGTHNLLDLTYNTARVWTGQRILSPSIKQEPSSFDIPFIQKADHPISITDAQRVLRDHYDGTKYDVANPVNKDTAVYRPISVDFTEESHLLQLKGKDWIHWLSLGITCQNVYVPFYPQGSVVPSFYRHGKDKYASNSAYWIYKEAQVLADRSWKDYGLQLYQARNATQQKLSQMRAEYDVKVDKEKDPAKKLDLINKANKDLAHTAVKDYQELIGKLITKQIKKSPLHFRRDPDL